MKKKGVLYYLLVFSLISLSFLGNFLVLNSTAQYHIF